VSSTAETVKLIEGAVTRILDEIPALQPLKLVFELDLRARGDTQQYRVELPGPKVTKTVPTDARVSIEVPRAFFNEMAKDGRVADWREAFMYGQAKATGPTQILQLIERVIDRHEERVRTRKVRPGS
jgi:hypothetical protein